MKSLRRLFDFQKFEMNESLDALIKETERRTMEPLAIDDDDLSGVAAAGYAEKRFDLKEDLESENIKEGKRLPRI